MKICFKCHKNKPLSQFYKHSQMGDGHLNKCKVCTKKDVRLHRVLNLEKIHEYDRNRKNEPQRLRQRYTQMREYKRRYPERVRAHEIVFKAIKNGSLVRKPCEVCEKNPAEAHHDDYSKPLEVRWLCTRHHHAFHRKYDYDQILKAQ